MIGLIGAVEAGVGLWYFTNGHWINGIFYVTAVVFLISVYIRRERKLGDQAARGVSSRSHLTPSSP